MVKLKTWSGNQDTALGVLYGNAWKEEGNGTGNGYDPFLPLISKTVAGPRAPDALDAPRCLGHLGTSG